MRVTEVKRHLDGRVQSFECSLVRAERGLLVVRFEHPAEGGAGGFSFPPGSVTFGFFWRRRHYSLYRIVRPDGSLIAHRFDVIDEVRLEPAQVEYLDLLLDVWVSPEGRVAVEDEGEVALFARRGLLRPGQVRLIERTRRLLERRHAAVIAEAVGLLAAPGYAGRRGRR